MKLLSIISSRMAALAWPQGGHRDDVAKVAMVERPLGRSSVALQISEREKKRR
jgi:hypothetical protein